MTGFPYIFTFYSYKGGVGRSMALLNVAYTLAGRGRHVLIVDMDLEAPGVSAFMDRQKEFAPDVRSLDVLNLLSEAVPLVQDGSINPAEAASKIPDVYNYRRPVDPKKLKKLTPRIGQLGRLDVIPADLSRKYWERHADLRLERLNREQLIALSRLLHHYFKQQRFPHRPLGLESFEPDIQTPYDYILVDSRTGITDVGGLCIGPLADRLIVLTGLNDQNVEGTASFMEQAGILYTKKRKKTTPWDEADPGDTLENPHLGPKPTLVVATPVPAGELAYKKARLKELEKKLGIAPIRLSYHPQVALMESVFVREEPDEYLSIEYRTLADRMMAQVRDTPSQLTRRSREGREPSEPNSEDIVAALRMASHRPDVATPLLNQLSHSFKPEKDSDFSLIGRAYALLLKSAPDNWVYLNQWGKTLSDQAKTKEGAEADQIFAAAMEKYAAALTFKPDSSDVLNNWGSALSDQAMTKEGAEASLLIAAAEDKHAAAIEINPDKHDDLFATVEQMYAAALKINPDKSETLNNWGAALARQAKIKKGVKARQLFAAARDKLLQAEAQKKGSAAYNLACLEALQTHVEESLNWLDVAISSGEHIPQNQLDEDTDFDLVRLDSRFIAFRNSLPEK